MTEIFSNDFTVRYDPINQRLSLWRIRQQETKLIEFKLQTLKGMNFDGAAKWIGETLLLLIPETRAVFLPETKADETSLEFIDELIDRCKRDSNLPDELFDLSMLYVVRFRFSLRNSDLVDAEKLMRQAASLGCQAASDLLESDWKALLAQSD